MEGYLCKILYTIGRSLISLILRRLKISLFGMTRADEIVWGEEAAGL